MVQPRRSLLSRLAPWIIGNVGALALLLVIWPDPPSRSVVSGPSRRVEPARPSMLEINRPEQPPVVQKTIVPMTDAAYRAMLASNSKPARRTAIDQLAQMPRQESVVLLIEHSRRELDGQLLAFTVNALKRSSVAILSDQAAGRLVEIFKHATEPITKAAILAAFETFPSPADRPHLDEMSRIASVRGGEEFRKVNELVVRSRSTSSSSDPGDR